MTLHYIVWGVWGFYGFLCSVLAVMLVYRAVRDVRDRTAPVPPPLVAVVPEDPRERLLAMIAEREAA